MLRGRHLAVELAGRYIRPTFFLEKKGGQQSLPSPLFFRRRRHCLDGQSYFLSSTSTYSASMTSPSFFCPLAPAPSPCAVGSPGPPAAGAGAELALYIASASLWLAWVSFSCAAFISCAEGVPSSVFFASAKAASTSVLSDACTFSPPSFSIFSTL